MAPYSFITLSYSQDPITETYAAGINNNGRLWRQQQADAATLSASISRSPISRAQLHFSSAAMHSFTTGAGRSRSWRCAMRLPRAFHIASRP